MDIPLARASFRIESKWLDPEQPVEVPSLQGEARAHKCEPRLIEVH